MSAHPEVSAAPAPADGTAATEVDGSLGPLRVRPPSPLPARTRVVVAAVAVALVVLGGVAVTRARSADGNEVPGGSWRRDPVPRSAEVDAFDEAGALGVVDGFGSWNLVAGSFTVAGGMVRSGPTPAVATVDAGSPDVLVHAQVVAATEGSGVLVSVTPDGRSGLSLHVVGSDRWELSWQRGGDEPEVLGTFTAPTSDVAVQIHRRGDGVEVAFDSQATDVDVPAASAAGTSVGIVATGPGTELELFGYLRLNDR